MAGLYRTVMDTFWSEYIWLPPNTTWQDIAPESSTEIQHPDYRHLFYPLPMALVMLYLRYVLEKWVEVMSVVGADLTRLGLQVLVRTRGSLVRDQEHETKESPFECGPGEGVHRLEAMEAQTGTPFDTLVAFLIDP
jgi:hypothetical protein